MYFYFKYTVNHLYEILNKNVVNILTPVILFAKQFRQSSEWLFWLLNWDRHKDRQAVNGRTYKHSQQKFCTSNGKLFRWQWQWNNKHQQPFHSQTYFPHGKKNYHIYSLTTKWKNWIHINKNSLVDFQRNFILSERKTIPQNARTLTPIITTSPRRSLL